MERKLPKLHNSACSANLLNAALLALNTGNATDMQLLHNLLMSNSHTFKMKIKIKLSQCRLQRILNNLTNHLNSENGLNCGCI